MDVIWLIDSLNGSDAKTKHLQRKVCSIIFEQFEKLPSFFSVGADFKSDEEKYNFLQWVITKLNHVTYEYSVGNGIDYLKVPKGRASYIYFMLEG